MTRNRRVHGSERSETRIRFGQLTRFAKIKLCCEWRKNLPPPDLWCGEDGQRISTRTKKGAQMRPFFQTMLPAVQAAFFLMIP